MSQFFVFLIPFRKLFLFQRIGLIQHDRMSWRSAAKWHRGYCQSTTDVHGSERKRGRGRGKDRGREKSIELVGWQRLFTEAVRKTARSLAILTLMCFRPLSLSHPLSLFRSPFSVVPNSFDRLWTTGPLPSAWSFSPTYSSIRRCRRSFSSNSFLPFRLLWLPKRQQGKKWKG